MEGRFGATFRRWRAVNTFVIGGRRMIANGALAAKGGGHGPVPPLPTPLEDSNQTLHLRVKCSLALSQRPEENTGFALVSYKLRRKSFFICVSDRH